MTLRKRLAIASAVLALAGASVEGAHYVARHSSCIDDDSGGHFGPPNCYKMPGGD
jgi:hypothetical protein